MDSLFSAAALGFEDLEKELGSWANHFSVEELTRLKHTLNLVNKERQITTVYPDEADVFKIYRDLPLEKVRVVILGQDPYFNGNAMGYAFGCKNEVSPSLKKISQGLTATYKTPTLSAEERKKDLSQWVEQGVFLLNTALTVENDRPRSHEKFGWDSFIKATLEKINKQDRYIGWMLWGGAAYYFKPDKENNKHVYATDNHPAYAARKNIVWTTHTFKKIDIWFEMNDQPPIRWI